MGFPSNGMEGLYRNHISDVQRFLNVKHFKKYRVYNLCTERAYNPELFGKNRVSHKFKFQDHNPPPFFMMHEFCKDAANFLSKSPTNVLAIHCKAGKGRTGVMICCYLVYAELCRTAHEALLYYGEMRTLDKKGVTIPS
jgi:phosphatidylinositol-3,4,5-trisphosphate 3-phosphatase/dual-specificity protein phosphatase PTEN